VEVCNVKQLIILNASKIYIILVYAICMYICEHMCSLYIYMHPMILYMRTDAIHIYQDTFWAGTCKTNGVNDICTHCISGTNCNEILL